MKTLKSFVFRNLILFFIIVPNLAIGQETETRTIKTDSLYFESSALFACNLQFPGNYKPDQTYPLVIGLHGGSASYETFKNIWRHVVNPQFIVATPQAPYKWLMGDKIGYDWSAWPTGDTQVMSRALKLTSVYIENLIKSLTKKYNISDVYLLGFSQGSIITQIAGINNHELLRGIIICSGPPLYISGRSPWTDSFEIGWPSKESVKSANKLKVFITHGKSDKSIDYGLANKSREQYKEAGFDVKFYEFEGGHTINAEAMKEIGEWIKNQK